MPRGVFFELWRFVSLALAAVVVLAGLARPVSAAWQPNGSVLGTVGSFASSDARGGAFIVDGDAYGSTGRFYHFDALANLAAGWPSAGLELVPGNQGWIHASIGVTATMPDGHGGFFVLAFERGPYPGSGGFLNPFQLYLHRRTQAGDVALDWPADGTLVESTWLSPPFSANNRPIMTTDGDGGVLIAWADSWIGNRWLSVQKIRGDGTHAWGESGVLFRNSSSVGSIPSVCSDGHGGALVFWAEWDPSATHLGIRAQHLKESGEAVWEPAGRIVSTRSYSAIEEAFPPNVGVNYSPHSQAIFAVPERGAGAMLAWSGAENGDLQVMMTRVSQDGGLPWNGDLHVCAVAGHQRQLTCAAAAGQAAVVAWQDHRDPNGPGIFSQSVSLSGRTRWSPEGVPVATGSGDRSSPIVHDDGRAGVFIAWAEANDGGTVRAQRLTSSGRRASDWPENGNEISLTAHPYTGVPLNLQLIDATSGSVIATWNDVREAPSRADFQTRLLGMLVGPGGPEGLDPLVLAKTMAVAPLPLSPGSTDRFFVRSVPRTATSDASVVEYAVPVGERATLEVVDVQGRRLLIRDVTSATSEPQRLRIADSPQLRTGVYFLRLAHGRHLATARVAVIR